MLSDPAEWDTAFGHDKPSADELERMAREACPHDDVEATSLGDVSDVDAETRTAWRSVDGICSDCGREMQGVGRMSGPDGEVDDIEWEEG